MSKNLIKTSMVQAVQFDSNYSIIAKITVDDSTISEDISIIDYLCSLLSTAPTTYGIEIRRLCLNNSYYIFERLYV